MQIPFSVPEGHRYTFRPGLPPSGEIAVVILIGFAAFVVSGLFLRAIAKLW